MSDKPAELTAEEIEHFNWSGEIKMPWGHSIIDGVVKDRIVATYDAQAARIRLLVAAQTTAKDVIEEAIADIEQGERPSLSKLRATLRAMMEEPSNG